MSLLPAEIPDASPFVLPEAARTRARTGRGTGGKTWWGRQWLNVVQERCPRQALDQGRRDTRRGRVLDIVASAGCITAAVGDEAETFHPRLEFDVLTAEQIQRTVELMSNAAVYAADLLAGQISDELPKIMATYGAKCLPEPPDEPRFVCSCGDESECCRHAAALALVIGEVLDEDPFMLLTIRGVEKERLMAAWRRAWGAPPVDPSNLALTEKATLNQAASASQAGVEGFYDLRGELPMPWEPAETTQNPDVIELLGFPPFFPAGDRTVMQTLDNLYDLNAGEEAETDSASADE